MMFSPELVSLVKQEQLKDHLRDLEHQHLIKVAAAAQRQDREDLPIKAVNWFGRQMVKWGAKLQNYNPAVKAT